LNDPVLRAKLAKGMGHNYYGEPAWPNEVVKREKEVLQGGRTKGLVWIKGGFKFLAN